MSNIRFYHGTDITSAELIQKNKVLIGKFPFGPGLCTSIERALNYSAIKCTGKYGTKAKAKGRVIVFELPETVLDNATKDAIDAYTLNDELGQPLKKIPITKMEILTVTQSKQLIN